VCTLCGQEQEHQSEHNLEQGELGELRHLISGPPAVLSCSSPDLLSHLVVVCVSVSFQLLASQPNNNTDTDTNGVQEELILK
jgi:hypothetical protein